MKSSRAIRGAYRSALGYGSGRRPRRSALEVVGNFRRLAERAAVDGVDGGRRLGLDVGALALALADEEGGDLGAVGAEQRDLQGRRVEPVARRLLAARRDDVLPL